MERLQNKRYITLIVKPTHQCNLNCPYCYDRLYKDQKIRMTHEMIEKILDVFSQDRVHTWIFHGGEPLIMGIEWYDKQIEIIKKRNPSLHISFQTNGTLIDRLWIKQFKRWGINHIGMSFDGSINDKTRKNTQRLIEVANLLRENGIGFGFIEVITEEVVDDLVGEYLYFKKLNIRNVQFNHIFEQQKNDESYFIDGERYQNGLIKFFEYWIYEKDDPYANSLLFDYLNRLFNHGRLFCNNIDCQGKWFSIYPDGNIYPCGRDWDERMLYQNLNEVEKIDDLYLSPNFKKFFTMSRKLLDHCKSCRWFYQCHSGCFQNSIIPQLNGELKEGIPNPHLCKSTQMVFEWLVNFLMYEFKYEEQDKYNPLFVRYLMERGFRSTEILKDYLRIIDKGGD